MYKQVIIFESYRKELLCLGNILLPPWSRTYFDIIGSLSTWGKLFNKESLTGNEQYEFLQPKLEWDNDNMTLCMKIASWFLNVLYLCKRFIVAPVVPLACMRGSQLESIKF